MVRWRIFFAVRFDDTGDTLWTRNYGWADNDICYDLELSSDSTYIMAGKCHRNNLNPDIIDYCLIKINDLGDTLWTRSYTKYSLNEAYAVRQTTDGGYILVGSAYGSGNYDIYIVKTDSFGDTLWTMTIDNSQNDVARSVQQTADGGYVIAGFENSLGLNNTDIYLAKLSESGAIEWERTYGGAWHDYGYWMEQTADGDI
jgi:hypothetical protein